MLPDGVNTPEKQYCPVVRIKCAFEQRMFLFKFLHLNLSEIFQPQTLLVEMILQQQHTLFHALQKIFLSFRNFFPINTDMLIFFNRKLRTSFCSI